MSRSVEALMALMALLGYIVAPVTLISAWIRWISQPRHWSATSVCSFASLVLATASGMVAISSVVWAQAIGGFGWYDPRLMKMMAWGLLLSVSAVVLSFGGVWRRNELRWQSPVASIGTAAFWLLVAALQ